MERLANLVALKSRTLWYASLSEQERWEFFVKTIFGWGTLLGFVALGVYSWAVDSGTDWPAVGSVQGVLLLLGIALVVLFALREVAFYFRVRGHKSNRETA